MATKIMLIRHGEKPSDEGDVRGVKENGSHDPADLTVRGWQRAGALIRFFAPYNRVFMHPALATPTMLFAVRATDHVKSVRSEHVLLPLSQHLNTSIDTSFDRNDESKLARAALACQGVVLIAWQHERIPEIAAEITGRAELCPRKWPDHRFDLVWILEANEKHNWALTQVPQLVLPGDSNEVVQFVRTAA